MLTAHPYHPWVERARRPRWAVEARVQTGHGSDYGVAAAARSAERTGEGIFDLRAA